MTKLELPIKVSKIFNKVCNSRVIDDSDLITLKRDWLSGILKIWEDKQTNKAKKIGGFSFLAISLAACNNSNNYSESDIENAKVNALTGSNGTLYSSVDDAISSNDENIKANALTGSNGTIYSSVDAAITSNDTKAINDAVSAATNFNTLSELISSYVALTDPSTVKLTTAATDIPNLTMDDDTIDSSIRNSLQTGDIIRDNSSVDNDILSGNVTVNSSAPTLINIENLLINGDFLVTGLALTNVSGSNILNFTTSLPGGTATVIDASTTAVSKINAGENIAILNVTSSSSGTGSTGVIINGGNASTINLNAGSGTDVYNVTVGDSSFLNLGPVANFGSSDTVNVFLSGNTTTITSAAAMGFLNISSSSDSTVKAVTSLGLKTDFTGSGNITLSTTGAIADAATSISSSGIGNLTLNLTNVNNNDVSTVSANTINHMHSNGGGLTISGSSTLNLDKAIATSTFNLNSPGTMVINVSESQTARIITGANVIGLTISATPDEVSDTQNNSVIAMKDLFLNAVTKNVALIGSDSMTITDLSTAATTTVSASSMTGDLNISEMAANNTTLILGSGTNKITSGNVAASFTILGSSGSDTINIEGTNVLASSVSTYGGNDTVTGGAGDDTISVGDGNDIVNGGAGVDVITLGSGFDTLTIVASEDGDTITDFNHGTDTLIITGTTKGDLNLTNLKVDSGAYDLDGAGTFDITLTNSTSTDLSNNIQLGSKMISSASPGEANFTTTTYTPLLASTYNITSGVKNDVISVAVNSGRTIKTSLGEDVIIATSSSSGNMTISDFDISNDTIILTGAAADKDNIDLTLVNVSSGKYTFSTNHIINLSSSGNELSVRDLSDSVQLGHSGANFVLNDATGATYVTGGKHNDYIELGDSGNADHVVFSDNSGVDTITSFSQGQDKLNFDGITGISANGVSFAAAASKVSDTVNGEVYIFSDQNLTGVNASFDFNGLNNDAYLGSSEVLTNAANFLESALTESNGEKLVALINTAKGETDIFAAYLIICDSDGIDSDDLILLGSIDSDGVLAPTDIV